MGSDILTDDGVGVKIVDYLSSDPYFQNHHYHTELLFNLDMGEKLSEYNTVVFIDGSIQRTKPPGYIEINEITNWNMIILDLYKTKENLIKDFLLIYSK